VAGESSFSCLKRGQFRVFSTHGNGGFDTEFYTALDQVIPLSDSFFGAENGRDLFGAGCLNKPESFPSDRL